METTPTPSHDEQTLHVCYCFDAAYARWAGISLYSLMKNLSPDVAVVAHCIHEGTSEADQSKFQTLQQKFKNLSVKFLSVESAPGYKPIGMERGWPNSIYFRLYMADLIECERIAFLDCDTLVTGNISTLNDIDLNGSPIAAVVDSASEYCVGFQRNPSLPAFSEISADQYFNSGFMWIDLMTIESDKTFEKSLDICKKHQNLRMPDQDALNTVLSGRWNAVDQSWNVQIGAWGSRSIMHSDQRKAYLRSIRSPKIIHFTRAKPWIGRDYMPYWRTYLKYWRSSPWGDTSADHKFNFIRWLKYQLRKLGRVKITHKQVSFAVGSRTIFHWSSGK